MAEKSRRELLAEAFDDLEKDDDDVAVEEEPGNELGETSELTKDGDGLAVDDESGTGEEDKEEKSERELGRGTPKKGEKVGKKPAATEEDRQEAEAARKDAEGRKGKDGAGGQVTEPVTDKAPNSWKPATREHWAKIPAEARAEITRRERQIEQTLSQTAQVRKFAGDFAAVVNPYAHLIRAQHSTPLAAVQNLMQTAAGLMVGSKEQKAAIINEIIQNYGVDVVELDRQMGELAAKNGGKYPTGGRAAAPQEQIPTWARPLLEQNQKLTEAQQQYEQKLQAEADEEIAKVENLPYFDDVRQDVADLLEVAANRGKKMGVKEAYQMAVRFNPEISKLVARAELQRRGGNNQQRITRARRAASAISGAPSASKSLGNKNEKQSRREMLSEAWDDATGD